LLLTPPRISYTCECRSDFPFPFHFRQGTRARSILSTPETEKGAADLSVIAICDRCLSNDASAAGTLTLREISCTAESLLPMGKRLRSICRRESRRSLALFTAGSLQDSPVGVRTCRRASPLLFLPDLHPPPPASLLFHFLPRRQQAWLCYRGKGHSLG